jgi:hypothetical protein
MAHEIWQGSSSFAAGNTPYGFYDTDTSYTSSADNFADWSARRLGYPIVDVELQSGSFYACFEEAVTEYAAQVNQFNIRDNLLHLQGQSTGSSLTGKRVTPTLGRTVFLAQQYGTEAGVGGYVDWKKGSITVVDGTQEYDLNALYAAVSESDSGSMEIKKIYHEAPAAANKYFDPYSTTGYGTANFVEGFGFGDYSPAVSFVLMPVFEDLLRLQAIEFNEQMRKSSYSFTLVNNKLRLFPKPTKAGRLYFDYVMTKDRDNSLAMPSGSDANPISDYSNVPYDNMEYKYINDVGRQWIRKYGLALCKELLGTIRSKFGTVPIPGSELQMDGETLRAEASTEKETLIAQLRENLEQTSRKVMMEADSDESLRLQEKLNKVPLNIYIG